MEQNKQLIASDQELAQLTRDIKAWGREFGFQEIAISDCELGEHKTHLDNWLANDMAGEMDYMRRHKELRHHPEQLQAGAIRAICVRMDYLPQATDAQVLVEQPNKAYVSRYALGRDYHKLIRGRLAKLAKKIEAAAGGNHRAFVDSAPILERALAEKSGMGWIGKNTMLINKDAGSWFFLGEIYTSLPLPIDQPTTQHCGSCNACIDICPTNAFTGPYQLDAKRCISYLTIELKGSIPEEFRKPMGNHVFGCDDCQTACPWNKFAQHTQEDDFQPRHGLDSAEILSLFKWGEDTFLEKTAGSAIRRIGHQGWPRNLAIGLGNAPFDAEIIAELKTQLGHPSAVVNEHITWAIAQQEAKASG
jgi:epoxyqueuosine reductase